VIVTCLPACLPAYLLTYLQLSGNNLKRSSDSLDRRPPSHLATYLAT